MTAAKRTAAAAEIEDQPAAGKPKRKKVIIKTPVPRELIEYMMAKPHMPLHGFAQEKLATGSHKFREFYAQDKAISDKILEYERALVKQFLKRGYAEELLRKISGNADHRPFGQQFRGRGHLLTTEKQYVRIGLPNEFECSSNEQNEICCLA
jgi:hypothetical protein